MKISFHGAAGQVTGSKHLLETTSGLKILLDCGMFQGNGKESDALNRHFGFNPQSIDVLLLSHAHIDHSGLIPLLVQQGFSGEIYCTDATFDLLKLMLLDSVKIQQGDLAELNKRRQRMGKEPIVPLYDEEDVFHALALCRPVEYETKVKIGPKITFWFTDAGHIAGAASIHIRDEESNQTVSYSGDVGRYNDSILHAPKPFAQTDFLILESTYGDSLHDALETTDAQLLEIILYTCKKKKGRLIIPAFSVGRTQELVYALNRIASGGALSGIPFFVDSPMSSKATELLEQHQECFNDQILEYMKKDPEPFRFNQLEYLFDREDSMDLNDLKEPCVIISASGMAEAGRVKHHIARAIGDFKNTILLAGYCAEGTLGSKLANGNEEVSIYGEMRKVVAEVKSLKTLSAHADYNDLLKFVSCQNPELVKCIYLVHGEPEKLSAMKLHLEKAGFKNVLIPGLHQSFDLV